MIYISRDANSAASVIESVPLSKAKSLDGKIGKSIATLSLSAEVDIELETYNIKGWPSVETVNALIAQMKKEMFEKLAVSELDVNKVIW